MAENKRVAVKWIRDRAKKAYEKDGVCFICGSTTELELHHLNSIQRLMEAWAKDNSYDISTDEGILDVRDQFIEEHKDELYNQVYTLCNTHHVKLHGIFGKSPAKISTERQKKWLAIQKAKHEGTYEATTTSPFDKFLKGK